MNDALPETPTPPMADDALVFAYNLKGITRYQTLNAA